MDTKSLLIGAAAAAGIGFGGFLLGKAWETPALPSPSPAMEVSSAADILDALQGGNDGVQLDDAMELLSPRDKRIDKELKQQEDSRVQLETALRTVDEVVGSLGEHIMAIQSNSGRIADLEDDRNQIGSVLQQMLTKTAEEAAQPPPQPQRKVGPPDGKPRVVLCASGSVATVKVPEMVQQLVDEGLYVDVILTSSADHFLSVEYKGELPRDKLSKLESMRDKADTPLVEVWRDSDEWTGYSNIETDDVVHIALAKRSQVLLVAPMSANTLGQVAYGLSSNLLTSMLRAWSYDLDEQWTAPLKAKFGKEALEKPVLVAPAMNTFMWYQNVTKENIARLCSRGIKVIPPVEKVLPCGDKGMGALASPEDIVSHTVEAMRTYEKAMLENKKAGCAEFTSMPAGRGVEESATTHEDEAAAIAAMRTVAQASETTEAEMKGAATKEVDWNADKIARKLASMPDIDPTLDIAAMRAKAQGAKMSDDEKKARGLLYDRSKASAVREDDEDSDDDGPNSSMQGFLADY